MCRTVASTDGADKWQRRPPPWQLYRIVALSMLLVGAVNVSDELWFAVCAFILAATGFIAAALGYRGSRRASLPDAARLTGKGALRADSGETLRHSLCPRSLCVSSVERSFDTAQIWLGCW